MKQFAVRTIVVIAIVFTAGFVLSSCTGRVYEVVGDDMEPLYWEGQIITAIPVPTQTITRGEPVVYQLDNGDVHFKRVVGVPGDVVLLIDGAVFINGAAVDSPQLTADDSLEDAQSTTLGTAEYYIVGDNLGNSYDSRHHGPVPGDHILGRVEVTLLNRLTRW